MSTGALLAIWYAGVGLVIVGLWLPEGRRRHFAQRLGLSIIVGAMAVMLVQLPAFIEG